MSIYNRYEALSPVYQGGLTNHLPMVVVALEKLDIDKERIIELCNDYKETRGIFDLSNTSGVISDFDQEYVNRTSYYLGELHNKGEDVVIGTFLNQRTKAIASGLFHGLIRLYYAKLSKNDLQIAQALAYFELISQNIEIEGKDIIKTAFKARFENLKNEFRATNFKFQTRSTMDKIEELLNQSSITDNLFCPNVIDRNQVLNLILKNYALTKDFYQLHLITGFHALIELEEYFVDFNEMLKHFLLIAEVITMMNLNENPIDLESSSEIEMAKIGSLNDVHMIKLIFSLNELNHLFEDKLLKQIAMNIK